MRSIAIVLSLAAVALAGEVKLGKPLTLKKAMTVEKLLAKADRKAGKTVKVRGTIRAFCQGMGCWMELADRTDGKGIRIKVEDGVIVFPKDAAGKTATAEGALSKVVAEAKHQHAAGQHDKDCEQPGAVYQIQGTGAVILE